MIIIQEKQELEEMALAVVPGFGNQKYKVISKDPDHLPLHAYVFDVQGTEICDFLASERQPQKIGDVKPCRSKAIPEDVEAMILEQAGKPEPLLPETSCWKYLTALTKTHLQQRFKK